MEESSSLVTPGLSRRGLFKGGLIVVAGAVGFSVASTALTAGIAHASETTNIDLEADYLGLDALSTEVQEQWTYCGKCRSLWYAGEGNGSTGVCAWYNDTNNSSAESGHTVGSSTNYGVIVKNPGFYQNEYSPTGGNSYLQSPWYWCFLCSSLFWGGGAAESYCPIEGPDSQGLAGYPHSGSNSGVYYMPSGMDGSNDAWTATSGATMQPGWRYCSLCKSLYWGNAWASSWCQYQIQNGPGAHNGASDYRHASGDTVYSVAMMS